jgi:glycosyltransferase involved in cell wall biosynthesis
METQLNSVYGNRWHKLSVCIPAYNEQEGIEATLRTLRANLPEAELIVVDDGSSDDTGQRARSVEGVIVLAHERNRGYGAALKTAMRHATRPVVAWYDSDGQHHPEDLKQCARPVLLGEKDAVIGIRGSGSDVRIDRVPGKWILKKAAEMMTRRPIPDLNSGLRCFRAEVVLRYLHLLPDGFSASSTTTMIMHKRNYRLGHVSITTSPRVGTSSVKMLRDGFHTLHLLLRLLVLFSAFKFFSLLAGLQLAVGILYGLWTALSSGLGFPVLASVIVISGVLTFFMGLLCDQIVALRLERLEGTFREAPDLERERDT